MHAETRARTHMHTLSPPARLSPDPLRGAAAGAAADELLSEDEPEGLAAAPRDSGGAPMRRVGVDGSPAA
eukprot:366554-Chlamydomonas_euryale.AAC.1